MEKIQWPNNIKKQAIALLTDRVCQQNFFGSVNSSGDKNRRSISGDGFHLVRFRKEAFSNSLFRDGF